MLNEDAIDVRDSMENTLIANNLSCDHHIMVSSQKVIRNSRLQISSLYLNTYVAH